MNRRKLWHPLVAVLTLLAVLVQGTWVLAGTTGGLTGTITDNNGAAVGGAKISASSPSQAATTTTDASGRFQFLSLAPDTYTLGIEKPGYQARSISGITVTADQNLNLAFTVQKTLTQIGRVTSRLASDVVKPGTVSDVYSISGATAEALQGLGGGNNIDNAYSAIQSVPGVVVPMGGSGWGQTIYIRGANYNQVGYEFDGVPINRAFDNYAASGLSNLGQQELQVFTGGAPTGTSSQTAAGYINQVIKTGTYPGFGYVQLGAGGPAYYHSGKFEIGGATPSRRFSWYGAVGGYTQDYRYGNQFNGAGLETANGITPAFSFNALTNGNYGQGALPRCLANGTSPNAAAPPTGGDAGCLAFFPFSSTATKTVSDREGVLNFHLKVGANDDVQLLYNGGAIHTIGFDSPSFFAPASYYSAGGNALNYRDGAIWPKGTTFGQPAAGLAYVPYLFPSSPTGRAVGAPIPSDQAGTAWNDQEIIKLQYQRNINDRSYLRIYGYSFYSDWLNNSPVQASASERYGYPYDFATPDYELDTHTFGGEIRYANQINEKNLIEFTANSTRANVMRFNNRTYRITPTSNTATNLVAFNSDGTGTCYSYTTGLAASCFSAATSGSYVNPTRGGATPPAGSPAALAGASWVVTRPGERGTYNTVDPVFTSIALQDEFRPNAKWVINGGLRYEDFLYKLTNSDDPANKFWFNAAAQVYCYDPATLQPVTTPLLPGQPPPPAPVTTAPGAACPNSAITGTPTAHPDGKNGHLLFTSHSNPNVDSRVLSPRIGATYTLNSDTVLRFSFGKFVEPTSTASVQYLDKSPRDAAAFNFVNTFGYGFNSPEHDEKPIVSYNADFSLEKHFKGTDMSLKLSPFYRYTKDQQLTVLLGTGFVSSINAADQTSTGFEFSLRKGDPSRNGFSGQLNYTYTFAFDKLKPLGNGQTFGDILNAKILAFNALTAAGGGSPCYDGSGTGTPYANCTVVNGQIVDPGNNFAPNAATGVVPVINPYYFYPKQGLNSSVGPYLPFDLFPSDLAGDTNTFITPHVFTGFVTYKHNKLTLTPNFVLQAGNRYGSPVSIAGIDPRTCTANSAGGTDVNGNPTGPIPTAPTPGQANWLGCGASTANLGTLFVPDPATKAFYGVGQFREPWQLNGNLQIGYEFTPKLKANLLLANVFNRCFGGSNTAWSSAYPPGKTVCGYGSGLYASNFYNGSSPYDTAANGPGVLQAFKYPFAPATNNQFSGTPFPFSAYLQVQVKL